MKETRRKVSEAGGKGFKKDMESIRGSGTERSSWVRNAKRLLVVGWQVREPKEAGYPYGDEEESEW